MQINHSSSAMLNIRDDNRMAAYHTQLEESIKANQAVQDIHRFGALTVEISTSRDRITGKKQNELAKQVDAAQNGDENAAMLLQRLNGHSGSFKTGETNKAGTNWNEDSAKTAAIEAQFQLSTTQLPLTQLPQQVLQMLGQQ